VAVIVRDVDIISLHRTPRPLPEPPRTKHVSKVGRPAEDAFGRILEEWLSDVRVRYTEPAD
jgi:hypothetical protein